MKKIFVSLLMCMLSMGANAQVPQVPQGTVINFQMQITDPQVGGVALPKSPVQSPLVSIDGHTLYLYDIGYDLTLRLVDENDMEYGKICHSHDF